MKPAIDYTDNFNMIDEIHSKFMDDKRVKEDLGEAALGLDDYQA